LFIQNPVETYNYKAYSDPLHYFSWIALAIFCLFVPPILFLIIRGSKPSPSLFGFTLGSSLAFTLGSVTMKGWNGVPRTMASKFAFFWYIHITDQIVIMLHKIVGFFQTISVFHLWE
jgi:hypothetical protein